jgi:hypothetical protein
VVGVCVCVQAGRIVRVVLALGTGSGERGEREGHRSGGRGGVYALSVDLLSHSGTKNKI